MTILSVNKSVCCVVETDLGFIRLQHIRLHFMVVRLLLLQGGIGISIILPPGQLNLLNTSIHSIYSMHRIQQ